MVLMVLLIISCQQDSNQSLKNIETFARLYGYVRFFHPSEEASKINWNHFAIHGSKQVEKTKNREELKQVLEELFLPMAPSLVIYHTHEKKTFSLSSITPKDTKGMKVITWQHRGVKLSDSPIVYNSIRVNRKHKILVGYGFGNLIQNYNAAPFRGKEFIFKAAVKVQKGSAQLWFRVDRTGRETGFFDNMHHNPILSNQWKTYEIKGNIVKDAHTIAFGCFLNGSGQMFTDDFQLSIKEKNQWIPVPIINPDFEDDPEGKTPNYWIAKGEGYIFQVTSQTAAKGNKSIMVESKTVKGPARLFHQRPKIGEHINKELGMGLSCIIPLALYGTPDNTYPTPPAQAFENLVNAIDLDTGTKEFSANDRYVRLANVVITWNVLQHFYPYFDVVKTDWSKVLTHTLQKAQPPQNEKDFLLILREMVVKLKDCQANVYHPVVKNQAGFPFKVDWIENRVVIIVSRDKQFQRGDIILSIDGASAEKALLNAEKYISGSPQWKRNQSLTLFGFGDENTSALLKVKRNEKTIEITAVRNFKGQVKEFIRKPIQELKDNIYYVNLDQVKLKELEAMIDELAKAKGVIFDARGYVAFEKRNILGYLVDKPIQTPIWHFPEVIYPDREKILYKDHFGKVSPKTPKIRGKVVFLVHGYTISASETFIGMVEHYQLGEIVGQRTAGTSGNINPFRLPGGYTVFWTGLRVLKQDHSQHHLTGIAPTVPVKRTLQGVKQGKDEFLEKAIEIILDGLGPRA
ncbi:S41 family peptidase, partial [Acidobacteriota bacterium]